jgi:hypothetical protein
LILISTIIAFFGGHYYKKLVLMHASHFVLKTFNGFDTVKRGRLRTKHWNRIPFTSSCVHPRFFGRICVCHIPSCLCFVFVLFHVCSKLHVSLDCPYLIAASGFSDLYLLIHNYSTVGNHTYHYRFIWFFWGHFEFPIHFFNWVLSQ